MHGRMNFKKTLNLVLEMSKKWFGGQLHQRVGKGRRIDVEAEIPNE